MTREISELHSIDPLHPDDFLILSASWENRCLGLVTKTKNYKVKNVLINIYDYPNPKRAENIEEIERHLSSKANIYKISTNQLNPITGINRIIFYIKEKSKAANPKITLDISCFTRKNLLQLLHALDLNGYLGNTNFYYTEPLNYNTHNNDSISQGINSINVIESFNGEILPSKDNVLIVFLNFEGKRALALWQHLEPHITIPVIPHPPFKQDWLNRAEEQNRLLLSMLNLTKSFTSKASPLDPENVDKLLEGIIYGNIGEETLKNKNYNFIIAPMGTKPQVLGIYRFWRKNPSIVTLMYPSPAKYKNDNQDFPAEKTWLIDSSINWKS